MACDQPQPSSASPSCSLTMVDLRRSFPGLHLLQFKTFYLQYMRRFLWILKLVISLSFLLCLASFEPRMGHILVLSLLNGSCDDLHMVESKHLLQARGQLLLLG